MIHNTLLYLVTFAHLTQLLLSFKLRFRTYLKIFIVLCKSVFSKYSKILIYFSRSFNFHTLPFKMN